VLTGEQAYNKRAKVGFTPGLTRQVAGFQVSAEPCVYMLDTPGIMVPAVPSDEVGFRLALAGMQQIEVYVALDMGLLSSECMLHMSHVAFTAVQL
jgi:ribosome biogenesis GTPase A